MSSGVIPIRQDALLYDEDSFSWFQAEGILSCNQDAARAFYKSVANLLLGEGEADYDMSTVEPDTGAQGPNPAPHRLGQRGLREPPASSSLHSSSADR